jgi:hypothetical protein
MADSPAPSSDRSVDWIANTPPVVGLVAMGCGLPVFFLMAHAGQPNRGIVAAHAIAVVVGVIVLCRPLLRKTWFKIYIIFASLIHAGIISVLDFPSPKIPIILVASPFVLLDMGMLLFGAWFLNQKFSNSGGA